MKKTLLVLLLGSVFFVPKANAQILSTFPPDPNSNITGQTMTGIFNTHSPNTAPSNASALEGSNGSGFYKSINWFYIPKSSHNICTASIDVKAIGNPTDFLEMDIYRAQNYPAGQTISLGTIFPSTLSGGALTPENATFLQGGDSAVGPQGTTSYETMLYTFTPCVVVVGGNGYWFKLRRTTAGSATDYYAIAGWVDGSSGSYDFPNTIEADGSWVQQIQFVNALGGGYAYPGSHTNFQINISGTQNYSAFEASSTTSFSSSTCTPPNSILDVGGGVSYALCFMFVPNSALIDQYANISTIMGTKIPFSYITSISNAIDNITLNATSSLPIFTIPLSHYASSTITGVIPDLTLSTTTISTYFTDSIRLPLKALLTAAIWLGAGWMVFGMAMTAFRP